MTTVEIDLAAIGDATRSAQGYTFIPEEQLKSIDPQLVEYDLKLRNKDNHVAIRCSPAGLKFLASFEQPKPIGLPTPTNGFKNGALGAPTFTQEVRDKFPMIPEARIPYTINGLPQPQPPIDLTHVKGVPLTDTQMGELGLTYDDAIAKVEANDRLQESPANRTISTFPIARGVPIPELNPRRAKKESPYPFEKLGDPDVVANVYDSFFIPTSPDIPNPGKKFGSTVSNANKKLAPKRFLIRTVEGGARVWRTV